MARMTKHNDGRYTSLGGDGFAIDKYYLDDLPDSEAELIQNAINKLATYEDEEEQGHLLHLPINEETPVYSIEYCCGKDKSNTMGFCFRGFCRDCEDKSYYVKIGQAKNCSICEINKSVFFTEEKANEKIQEMIGR